MPTPTNTTEFARDAIGRLSQAPLSIINQDSGEAVQLPPAVAILVRQLLETLAAGRVAVVTAQKDEMTPNEAAEFLNVSRPYLLRLLDEGTLPFRLVGTHRRIPSDALARYKHEQRARSRKAIDELIKADQALGLYENAGPPPPKSVFRGTGGGGRGD